MRGRGGGDSAVPILYWVFYASDHFSLSCDRAATVWKGYLPFSPLHMLSLSQLMISLSQLMISLSHLLISISHLMISLMHLMISLNALMISLSHLMISLMPLMISLNDIE